MAKYLYNGLEYPALPEWDKNEFPYAIIWHQMLSNVYLLLTKEPWRGTDTDHVMANTNYGKQMVNGSPGLMFRHISDNNSWEYHSTDDEVTYGMGKPLDANGTGLYVIMWSNHDIIGTDGSVMIAATDPVPATTPQDFYIVKNGVGQKQDFYLRVGGQSVKLDEYLI